MPNKTQIMTAVTVIAGIVIYNMVAPRLGLPSV